MGGHVRPQGEGQMQDKEGWVVLPAEGQLFGSGHFTHEFWVFAQLPGLPLINTPTGKSRLQFCCMRSGFQKFRR